MNVTKTAKYMAAGVPTKRKLLKGLSQLFGPIRQIASISIVESNEKNVKPSCLLRVRVPENRLSHCCGGIVRSMGLITRTK